MNFFERFSKPKKSDEESEREYAAAQESLLKAAEEWNKTLRDGEEKVHEAKRARAEAEASLKQTLEELEKLNS